MRGPIKTISSFLLGKRVLAWLFLSAALLSLYRRDWAQSAGGGAPASAPQVLILLTNSESMDGDTSGAIMTGSGQLASSLASLYNSSSPPSYPVPAGFTPPVSSGANGSAPYTVSTNGLLYDNSASRLNIAKEVISQALQDYSSTLNFGLMAYATQAPALYATWVYYMSPAGGFTFTNTPVAGNRYVANPCYNYPSASSAVQSACASLAGRYGAATVSSNQYLQIAASSDDASVNDVLYASGLPGVFITYNGPTPPSPYPPNFSLSQYEQGSVLLSYDNTLPDIGPFGTSPTNAGYVPYSSEVMYAQRGFGYGAAASATTGQLLVAMGSPASAFSAALAPETNNPASSEIKASAGQSPIAGLLSGAQNYLSGLTRQACQPQYVILVTDGLPTQDLQGHNWPPLGSAAAQGYGVSASFNPDGSLAQSNDQALLDAVSALQALARAGIKTYVIGLGAGVNNAANPAAAQTLQAMAIAGGTQNYYPAGDTSALNAAFQSILNQIYSSSSISAPIAPLTVPGGGAYEYLLVTNPAPVAGHVYAYGIQGNGQVAGTPSWDAGAVQTLGERQKLLTSTSADGKTLVPFAQLDPAAFSLSPTACVPDTATIVAYTLNPSYTYTPPGGSPCSYLAGRQPNWPLGGFSAASTGLYAGPPGSATLLAASGYIAYAQAEAHRPALLLFTDNDGFLYAADARTGSLVWGWTPRSLVAQMQNYASFQQAQWMNGGLAVVDAQDAAGNWASYVVGSAQSGAEHYALKLDSNGVAVQQIYDTVVAGGTSPGDAVIATPGQAPSHETPQIARIFSTANGVTQVASYALYVVNVSSSSGGKATVTSTLYEQNIATGGLTSARLPFAATSALTYIQASDALWAGDASGAVWEIPISGNAAADAGSAFSIGSTLSPTTAKAIGPVTYVGYTETGGVPFVWAANPSQITVFTIGANGWQILWAATPSGGYRYSNGAFSLDSQIPALATGSAISAAPALANNALVVPVYVPASGSACGGGSGYYYFYSLSSGRFPENTFTYQGNGVLSALYLGSGAAFAPSATITASGVQLGPGTAQSLAPLSPLGVIGRLANAPVAWREH